MNHRQKLLYLQLRYVEIPKFYLKAYWLKLKKTLMPIDDLPKSRTSSSGRLLNNEQLFRLAKKQG